MNQEQQESRPMTINPWIETPLMESAALSKAAGWLV